jgi:hypothetical protein
MEFDDNSGCETPIRSKEMTEMQALEEPNDYYADMKRHKNDRLSNLRKEAPDFVENYDIQAHNQLELSKHNPFADSMKTFLLRTSSSYIPKTTGIGPNSENALPDLDEEGVSPRAEFGGGEVLLGNNTFMTKTLHFQNVPTKAIVLDETSQDSHRLKDRHLKTPHSLSETKELVRGSRDLSTNPVWKKKPSGLDRTKVSTGLFTPSSPRDDDRTGQTPSARNPQNMQDVLVSSFGKGIEEDFDGEDESKIESETGKSHVHLTLDYWVHQTLSASPWSTLTECINKLDGLMYVVRCYFPGYIELFNPDNQELLTRWPESNKYLVKYFASWKESGRMYVAVGHVEDIAH